MPDLPGCTERAPQQLATCDDADADAGGGLDEDQVAVVLEVPAPLGQRHHVGVVVHEDRRSCELAQEGRELHAVPAGHDR